jgi:hypothetical protein
VGVANRSIAAGDRIPERRLTVREQRRKRGNGHDGDLGGQRLDDRQQLRSLQAKLNPAARCRFLIAS